jgi:hypothetical protein
MADLVAREKELVMRTSLIALLGAGLLIGLFALPAGCPPTGTQETGTLRLLVTDKPYPVGWIEEATVTITRVEVLPVGGADADDADDGDGDSAGDAGEGDDAGNQAGQAAPDNDGDVGNDTDDGSADGANEDGQGNDDAGDSASAFITIFEEEKTFDLLDLQDGQTALLALAEIPEGTYKQMRLIVTEGYVRLTENEGEWTLRVPSGAQSGIKLHFTFEVNGDEETTLLLDIDLSRAFTPVPGADINDPSQITEFKFQPSLAMRLIDLLDAGSISGTVSVDGESDTAVHVTAYNGDIIEVTSTSTGEGGTYVLSGLPAGTYRVEFWVSDSVNAEMADIEVNAGEDTGGVDVTLADETTE